MSFSVPGPHTFARHVPRGSSGCEFLRLGLPLLCWSSTGQADCRIPCGWDLSGVFPMIRTRFGFGKRATQIKCWCHCITLKVHSTTALAEEGVTVCIIHSKMAVDSTSLTASIIWNFLRRRLVSFLPLYHFPLQNSSSFLYAPNFL